MTTFLKIWPGLVRNAGIHAKKGKWCCHEGQAMPVMAGLKTVSGAHESGIQGHPCP